MAKEEGDLDRRKLNLPQTILTVLLAFGASYAGTQTKTAVHERAITSLETTIGKYAEQQSDTAEEMRRRFDGLATLVNQSNQKNGEALAANSKEIESLRRENEALSNEMKRADDKNETAISVQALTIKNIQLGIAEMKGELKSYANQKKE